MGTLSLDQYLAGIRSGNRQLLSRAITLVESTLPEHQQLAQDLIEACLPLSGNSVRVGITGVPGVGKSTFIEALGLHLIRHGKQVAVLAIDPSSAVSRGSILGDKTRMNDLAAHPKAYIRPSPSAGNLGGVARRTREAIILCEAAGFDVVIIETVGVGQSETLVGQMVDFFLLLMLAGAGDELQGIKRGIMEMADALIINKADGDNVKAAERAANEYRNALHLLRSQDTTWEPKVATCSALEQTHIAAVWQLVLQHQDVMQKAGLKQTKRQQQSLFWFRNALNSLILDDLNSNEAVSAYVTEMEAAITSMHTSPYRAAQMVIARYLGKES